MKRNLVEYLSICKCLNIKVNNKDEEECDNIKPEKKLEFKALELFQHIDHHGNYTNPQWFLSLDKFSKVKFFGKYFNCPKNPEKFLEFLYGDWKKPLRTFNKNEYMSSDR